jgi:hypothetical protein
MDSEALSNDQLETSRVSEEDAMGRKAEKNLPAEDAELAAREAVLTQGVQGWLDSMNRASADVNTFERQLQEAHSKRRILSDQLGRLSEEVRAQCGSAIDRARPYLEIQEAENSAQKRVEGAVQEYSAASAQHSQAKAELRSIEERLAYGAHNVALDSRQQEGLSRATVRVLRCQNERDSRERDYAKAFKEYQELHQIAESRRAQIGDATIRKAQPWFKRLHHHQQKVAAEQKRIEEFAEKAKDAKSIHKHSMNELERISNAVHALRSEHEARKQDAAPPSPSKDAAASEERQTIEKVEQPSLVQEPEIEPETELLTPEVENLTSGVEAVCEAPTSTSAGQSGYLPTPDPAPAAPTAVRAAPAALAAFKEAVDTKKASAPTPFSTHPVA